MLIWVSGMPGSGKSTLANYFFKRNKKKIKNLIIIDGDGLRKAMNNDLGYSIRARKIQQLRLTKLAKYFVDQKVNVIVSANAIFKTLRIWRRKNILNYLEVYIDSENHHLIKRNKNRLNLKKSKFHNILGKDIKVKKPFNSDVFIENNSSKKKFLDDGLTLIEAKIKKKRINIY